MRTGPEPVKAVRNVARFSASLRKSSSWRRFSAKPSASPVTPTRRAHSAPCWARLDLVLQARQLNREGERQQVGAGEEHLAELDEDAPDVLERILDRSG